MKPLRPWHYLLLVTPYIGLLIPGWYASTSPVIFGVPFFYAYQFLWVPLTSLIIGVVYRSTREPR